jgi:hypothetical protein
MDSVVVVVVVIIIIIIIIINEISPWTEHFLIS